MCICFTRGLFITQTTIHEIKITGYIRIKRITNYIIPSLVWRPFWLTERFVWRWISKVTCFRIKKICGKQASEKQKLLKSLPSWVNQFKKMIYHVFFISENIYLLSVLLWKQYKDVNIPLCENDLHCSLLYS